MGIILMKKVYNKILENIFAFEENGDQKNLKYYEHRTVAKGLFTDIVKEQSPFEIKNFNEAWEYMRGEGDYSFDFGFNIGEGKYPLMREKIEGIS